MKKFLSVIVVIALLFMVSCSKNYKTYEVTYSARCTQNDSVGGEWDCGIKYNGEVVESGSYITVSNRRCRITAFATEFDSSRNDYGTKNISFGLLDVGEVKAKTFTVTVRENGGRYSGNTAKWDFVVTVRRIS